MAKTFALASMPRIARWTVALLLGLSSSGCLLDEQFKSEDAVFTANDAVVPEAIVNIYGLSESEAEDNAAYLRFFPLSDSRFAAEAIFRLVPEDDEIDEWQAKLYDGFFVALDGPWYVFVQNHDDGQGYTILRVGEDGLGLLPVSDLDMATREDLARRHGIELADRTTFRGKVSRESLMGFLVDVRAQLLDEAKATLPAAQSIPLDTLNAAYADLGPDLVALPPDDFSGDLEVSAFLTIMRSLDQRGVSWGSYMMARLSANGQGVKRNPADALRYAHRAIDRGLERAQNVLAFLALSGLGETKDEQKALALLRASAAAGEPRAMLGLSNMYLHGTVLEKDTRLGLEWLTKSAEGGLPQASFELGRRYLDGDGVPQDDAAALKWLGKAAGYNEADAFLGWMYANGRGIGADQVRANQLYLSAARDGQPWAQWQIGERLIAGTWLAPDREAGIAWIRKAADAGLTEAKSALSQYAAAPSAASRANDGAGSAATSRTVGTQLTDDAALEKTASMTKRIADLILDSPWARETDDGDKAISIEFYSRAGFHFAVAPDRSECYFHFWRTGSTPEMVNRAIDKTCDGTVEIFETFEKNQSFKPGPLPPYQRAFYNYYLRRYAELFEAVNGFKSYLPEAHLALLPDFNMIKENRKLLQSIVNAATGSELGAVPRDDDERERIGGALMKIWVNSGDGPNGFVVAFSAEPAGGGYLRDCFISVEDSSGKELMLDENCDAIPESGENNQGSRRLSTAGNEKVVHSVLLEIARFADVANTWFQEEDIEPVARAAAALELR